MKVVWSIDQISSLINLYKQHSLLWDPSNKDYKNKLKKENAWADISRTLDIPQKEVETKMIILRSQFAREKKKYYSGKTTESGDYNKSKWMWYNALKFLLSIPTSSRPTYCKDDALLMVLPQSHTVSLSPQLSVSSPSSPDPLSNTPNKRQCNDIQEQHEISSKRHTTKDMDESKDEFEIYAQYVASELRNVTDQRALVRAKFEINNILLRARMAGIGGFGDGGSSNRYHSMSTTAEANPLRFHRSEDILPKMESESITDSENEN